MLYVGLFAILLIGAILAVVIVRSRQLKFKTSSESLLYATGVVTQSLSPTGAVLINGELFVARSSDGNRIPSSTNIKVVGTHRHLLVCESL